MKVVLILMCVFAIIGLTYLGAGAWLRDRRRNTERGRASGGDEDRD